MSRSFTPAPGYVPCACRDCFEIAIGTPGAMCHECEDTGCAPDRECQAAEAYGGEAEPSEAPTLPPRSEIIRQMCEAQGYYVVTENSWHPGVVLSRLLCMLGMLDRAAYERVTAPGSRIARVPAEAHHDERHPHWDGDGAEVLADLFEALTAAAPAGFTFTCDGEYHRMGFFR